MIFLLLALAAGAIGAMSACTFIVTPTTGNLAVTLEPLSSRGIDEVAPEGIPMEIRAPASLASVEKRMGIADADSKAWVAADKVLFELYRGAVRISSALKTYPSTQTINASSTLGVVTLTGIEAGSYDSLKVSIYNNAYDSVPVSIGWAYGIVITSGGTASASVNCIPVLVTAMTENAWSDAASLPIRGEKWYQVITGVSPTTFSINRLSGNLDLYVFDSSGQFAGNEVSSSLGVKNKTLATPDTVYYVALFGFSSGSAQVKWVGGIGP
jgi:hypothetical protein